VTDQLRLSTDDLDPEQMRVRVDAHKLRVSGELDVNTVPHLWASLSFAFEPDRPIRVDMSEVTFIDSSALAALLSTADERGMQIVDPSPQVRRLLSITGLADRFGIE
jgi:anti-anti-sigma factor